MSALPVEEYENIDDDDNTETIRCKWIGDGSKTLDDLIERLNGFIKYVQHLKSEGWELIDVMNDDYGCIRQK
jgi:hypothetical protein